MADNKNLFKQGHRWYVAVEVPPSLRTIIGAKRLTKALGTDDVREARVKRHNVVSEFKTRIATARKSKAVVEGVGVTGRALTIRRELQAAEARKDFETVNDLQIELYDQANAVEQETDKATAQVFYDVGAGLATPIGLHLEDWLAESNFTDRTKADHRYAVNKLIAWLHESKLVDALQTMTSKAAGRFKSEAMVAKGANHKTANKWLSSLRTYWRWLDAHGHIEGNPWAGKSLPKPKGGSIDDDDKERPFTDKELALLLGSSSSLEMRDAMALAALSGMRLEEIFQLTVDDCQKDVFNIRRSKTKAGQRKVPIHSLLLSIVKRRSSGKDNKAFLLEEATASGWDNRRSDVFTKRFATYRRRLGVDELREDKRRSLVNFHSFRRWFITAAEQAGNSENIVMRVVGHKLQGMAFGVYSGGASLEQLRACVESVRLPTGFALQDET